MASSNRVSEHVVGCCHYSMALLYHMLKLIASIDEATIDELVIPKTVFAAKDRAKGMRIVVQGGNIR